MVYFNDTSAEQALQRSLFLSPITSKDPSKFKFTALNPQLCAATTQTPKAQNTQNFGQPCPQQFTEHIEQGNSDNLPPHTSTYSSLFRAQ